MDNIYFFLKACLNTDPDGRWKNLLDWRPQTEIRSDSSLAGLRPDGVTTWLGKRERDGCGCRRTGLFGESWRRPMSINGRLSADIR